MENNQDDIKNFVNRFKKYITFIIVNSAINYSKKIKLRRKREIELDEQIIDNMVCSNNNEYGSNYNNFKFEYLTDEYIKEITKALTIREKIIIEDFVNSIPSKITATKLNTSVNTIDVLRNRAKNKIKRKFGGKKWRNMMNFIN